MPESEIRALPSFPSRATASGAKYWIRAHEDFDISIAMSELNGYLKRVSDTRTSLFRILENVNSSVASVSKDEDKGYKGLNLDDLRSTIENSDKYVTRYASLMESSIQKIASEVWIVRSTDNFLSYLSDILTEVLLTRPEILKSSQVVIAVGELLEHDTISSIIESKSREMIRKLSFKGLRDIKEYVAKRLNMPLIEDPSDEDSVRLSIAARNLASHTRGLIDEHFIRTTSQTHGSKGEQFDYLSLQSNSTAHAGMRIVASFDRRVAEKYSLPVSNFRIPTSWMYAVAERRAEQEESHNTPTTRNSDPGSGNANEKAIEPD